MSFFRYPGNKKRYAQYIIPFINKNANNYCEPFMGTNCIAIQIANTNCNYIGNDLDENLCHLWKSCLDNTDEVLSLIQSYTPTVDDFFQFKKELQNKSEVKLKFSKIPHVDLGFKKIVCHQTSFAGCGENARGPIGGKYQTNYKITNRWNPNRLKTNITNIKEKLSKFKNIQFTNLDFRKVLENCSPNTFVYLDPPFLEPKKNNQLYKNTLTFKEHEELAEILRCAKFNWLLSNGDSPEIRKIYHWADVGSIACRYNISKKFTSELLIKNPP